MRQYRPGRNWPHLLQGLYCEWYHNPAQTFIHPVMAEIMKGDHWKDGKAFRPERFLDGNGNLRKDEHFIPFSIGRPILIYLNQQNRVYVVAYDLIITIIK